MYSLRMLLRKYVGWGVALLSSTLKVETRGLILELGVWYYFPWISRDVTDFDACVGREKVAFISAKLTEAYSLWRGQPIYII